MNVNQKQLIKLISYAIRGKGDEISTIYDARWKIIEKLAECHKIEPLLFSAIHHKSSVSDIIGDKDFNRLKKHTILTSLYQVRHFEQIKKLFKLFKENNISAIGLKGIVIRELYPNPQFRLMSDSDILVKKQDIEKVCELLNNLGYYQTGLTSAHLSFEHKEHFPIDLHWTLKDKRKNVDTSEFDEEVWKNIIYLQYDNVLIPSLSWEDMLVHLCLHMAGHTISGGFGIRQLCDIVLLIEKKGSEIDWESFKKKIKNKNIEVFTYTILNICKELFNIDIPKQLLDMSSIKQEYLDMFIDYIVEGGVYGKRNIVNSYSDRIALQAMKIPNNSSRINVIKQFGLMFFPRVENLKNNYAYSKKYSILLPLAWLQHLIKNIFIRKSTISEKIKFVIFTIPIARRRYRLFKYLEL